MEQYMDETIRLDAKREKTVFSKLGFAYFLLVLITTLLQLGAAAAISAFWPEWMQSEWYIWTVSMLPLYIIAVPVCIMLLRRIPAQSWEGTSLKLGEWMRIFVICIGVMYIGNIIGQLLSLLMGSVLNKEIVNSLGEMVTGTSTWINLLFAVLIVPVMEELVFRKLLIDRLHKYGDKLAILVSALMFGLVHGNLYQFFYAFGLGAIFAYVYLKTCKVRYTVYLHMSINAMGSVIGPLLLNNVDMDALSALESGAMDPQAILQTMADIMPQALLLSLYGFLMIGMAVAGVVLLIKSRKQVVLLPGTEPLPRGRAAGIALGNAGMIAYILGCILMFAVSVLA